MSSARNGQIAYVRVTSNGASKTGVLEPQILISSGLVHPQGIAVDQKRRLLLVADSELGQIVSYGLNVGSDGTLSVDEPTPVAEGVEGRWVAVDGSGNIFFTHEVQNQLLKISARQVLDGDTTPTVLHSANQDGGSHLDIAAPGGIAVDNFHVYWTNKKNGDKLGTVVKTLGMQPNASARDAQDEIGLRDSPKTLQSRVGHGQSLQQIPSNVSKVLAKNVPKAYGLCMAINNVFFTDPDNKVYGITRSGGRVVTVTSNLTKPRGCAWDGDSTIYVADREAHGIFAFPGPMTSLAQTGVRKVSDFKEAFGVAVFSQGRNIAPGCWVFALMIVCCGLRAVASI